MSSERRNRLAESNSPYLIQHADNPVHWQPWGRKAFELAAAEDKPLFISIGYSTCHWCHVMARESFQDEEAAGLLNRAFVPVKVDREERPDIDAFYMDASLLLNGSGGWPLTVLATPEGRPFFVATYIPKHGNGRSAGLMEIVPEVERMWREERSRVLESADSITAALHEQSGEGEERPAADGKEKAEESRGISGIQLNGPPSGPDAEELTGRAVQRLAAGFDTRNGGFGGSPKFPQPQLLRLLLQRSASGDEKALSMADRSLRAMRAGGIYDHIGFGFHRYAVDAQWRVPHFEKMLYDQGLLALVYLEAYETSGEELFADTAREILEFVQRELSAPEGGFYSALDAESGGGEGRFYLWDDEEFRSLLENEEEHLADFFHLQPGGNWSDPHGGAEGSNILYADIAQPRPEPQHVWERARRRLLFHREERPRPATDDKVLTDWNGMVLRALARGVRRLQDGQLLETALRTEQFLLSQMRTSDGGLLHSYRAGRAAVTAHLDDYAFLIAGLLELYRADFDPYHLEQARELTSAAVKRFADERRGGFFFAPPSGPETEGEPESELLPRGKRIYDAAAPSGYGVMTESLLQLFRLTGEPEYRDLALRAAAAAESEVSRAPQGAASLLSALQLLPGERSGWEIVIVGDGREAERMLSAAESRYLPHTVVLRKRKDNAERLAAVAPFTRAMEPGSGGAAAYVCRGFQCRSPVTTAAELARLLDAE
jgi:hypothetical protein